VLRGGPFSEKRVIELINRRFVPFFFNVGKQGRGYDAAAAAFIAKVDPRFGGNAVPTPPVWVFSPDGTLLTTIDNYAPKAEFYDALRQVLRDHPELDRDTPEESEVFVRPTVHLGQGRGSNLAERLAAARLYESLGRWAKADGRYRMLETSETREGARALLGRARLARYRGDGTAVDRFLKRLQALDPALRSALRENVAMELGYRLLAQKRYRPAYRVLTTAARAFPAAKRLGELHFYAGVAAFHLEQRDWAAFHWCWVMKHIPDDHLYMRCYLAATADAMPYPNPELGGYRGKSRMISHALADRARDEAVAVFETLEPKWDPPAEDF
jgi:tetratricopeptide (TPR) repeat protein